MPRPIDDIRDHHADEHVTETRSLWLTRRTARSFAAAASVLLIATLVVSRSSDALDADQAAAAAEFELGTIELTDDDEGRSLFDLTGLTPARPVEQCIEVTYSGTILPVSLHVRAAATGDLAEHMDAVIHEGRGGEFGSCDGFEPDGDEVYSGTVAGFVSEGWIGLGNLINRGESRTFRISLRVHDDEAALGKSTAFELAWEVAPS